MTVTTNQLQVPSLTTRDASDLTASRNAFIRARESRVWLLHRAEPEYFERHVQDVMTHLEKKPLEHRLAFVKSWNEWAEGNYLEPDLRYGKKFLEVIKKFVVTE